MLFPQISLRDISQDKMLEAFRDIMGNPKWGILRSLFNKELDDDVSSKMKSTKWLEHKGITSKAD